MAVGDLIEIKFRLADGTDIGLNKYSPNITVGSLKEKIIAQWPKEKENGPKSVNDVNLINAGRILENNKTLGESRVPISEVPGWAITMFVVVRPPIPGKNSGIEVIDKKREKSKVRNYPPRISYMPGVMKKYYTSDGRLIIKEERVDSHEYFQAHRDNGRLTLHLHRNDAVSDDDVMQHPNKDQSECKTFDGDDDKGKRIKHDDPTVYQTGASSSSM